MSDKLPASPLGHESLHYETAQIDRVLQAGPAHGEDWFHLKITGAKETKWLNINRDDVEAIQELLRYK
jgi:hypothetical protein